MSRTKDLVMELEDERERAGRRRTVSAQLVGRPRAAVHWVDGVDRVRPYCSVAASGYWRARCGLTGFFQPVLHRRASGAPWCRRCQPWKSDAIRLLGNGVVPLVAAVAFRLLCDRLEPQ